MFHSIYNCVWIQSKRFVKKCGGGGKNNFSGTPPRTPDMSSRNYDFLPSNIGSYDNGITTPITQQLHHRLGHIIRTLHADIEKPTTLEKTFNKLHKINIYVFMKKIKFCWNNLYLIVGTAQYYDTQQTIHNTTNNTQHKINSCYVISFETFFCHFWRGGLFELDWFRDRWQLNSLLTATEDGC